MSAAWLAIPAAIVCLGGTVYQWLGAILVARWLREASTVTTPKILPPVTLLRPLKAGVPELREKLERLVAAMRPGDQLVLGATDDSAELVECERLARTFAERQIAVMPCAEGAALNPKISKLVQMDAACRHERVILSDSEALIDATWLDALRSEWDASGADVLTTGYRFVGAKTWPQCLDAAPALLSLWPGLALVRRFGHVDFTLGACTALRRADLAAVGGWRAFGDFLAEDRELGTALVARGRTIRLASVVTTLDTDPLTWRDWWRHQRRVAVTYRVGAPAGFAGMIFTHSVTAALALALAPVPGDWRMACFATAALSFAWRLFLAVKLARLLGASPPRLPLTMLVDGVVESLTWALSWMPLGVWWSGRRWRLKSDGRLVPPPVAISGS